MVFINLSQESEQNMSIVLDFLNILDKDATVLRAYKLDGKGMMSKFGLNAEEQQAVLSGSKEKVAALLGISADGLPSVHVNGTYADDTPGESRLSESRMNESKQQTVAAQQIASN